MLTLKSVKQELGYPNENATSDEELKRYIRQVTGRIRQRTGRLIAYACDDIQKGATTADLRVIGRLRTGDYVYVEGSGYDTVSGRGISGHSRGRRYAANHEDSHKAGRAATVHPKLTAEFRSVREDYCWIPQRWVPLLEIQSCIFGRTRQLDVAGFELLQTRARSCVAQGGKNRMDWQQWRFSCGQSSRVGSGVCSRSRVR